MVDRCMYLQHELADLNQAVLDDDAEKLDALLFRTSTDINKQNSQGDTPLLLSFSQNRSDQFIMRLLNAGCDIKISNADKVTPLHLAVLRPTTYIADELIKRGADINAQDGRYGSNKKTPLHYAVQCNHLEMVCMLLYYGADVYITSSDRASPLKYAVFHQYATITAILMEHYDKSYFSDKSIIKRFVNDNEVECEGITLLKYTNKQNSPEMFKSIWYRIETMLWNSSSVDTLLVNYVNQCNFPVPDWLECLYLILRSSFIESDVKYINEHQLFFHDLCFAFHRLNIELNDRMTIMNICLSLGIVPNRDCCVHAHLLYGFNEEFEALFYRTQDLESMLYFFPSFILSLENCDLDILLKLFKFHFHLCTLYRNILCESVDYCINMLRFFSMSRNIKDALKVMCLQQDVWTPLVCIEILMKIDLVPEFPTLLELSRNAVRKNIKQSCKVKLLYQYQDIINSFNVPQHLKDILRFKKPLY